MRSHDLFDLLDHSVPSGQAMRYDPDYRPYDAIPEDFAWMQPPTPTEIRDQMFESVSVLGDALTRMVAAIRGESNGR